MASITFTLAQKLQHEAVSVNILVLVTVFKSDTSVDDLTIMDFEINKEGKLQEIEFIRHRGGYFAN